MLVICGRMLIKVSITNLPNDLNNLNILSILKDLMTVAVVEISIPILNTLIMIPASVPTTIAQSNKFHLESIK